MRFDSLVRLIQSADYMSFREIALLTLRARGFATPAIRDGWSDGGSDMAVYTFALQPLKFAIQISVEKDWRAKLRQDARKAKKTLGTNDFLFVTSQRLAEVEFQAIADELVRDGIERSAWTPKRSQAWLSNGILPAAFLKQSESEFHRRKRFQVVHHDRLPHTPTRSSGQTRTTFGLESSRGLS